MRIPSFLSRLLTHARGWTFAASMLFAAAAGVAIRIYVVASRRGFL